MSVANDLGWLIFFENYPHLPTLTCSTVIFTYQKSKNLELKGKKKKIKIRHFLRPLGFFRWIGGLCMDLSQHLLHFVFRLICIYRFVLKAFVILLPDNKGEITYILDT